MRNNSTEPFTPTTTDTEARTVHDSARQIASLIEETAAAIGDNLDSLAIIERWDQDVRAITYRLRDDAHALHLQAINYRTQQNTAARELEERGY